MERHRAVGPDERTPKGMTDDQFIKWFHEHTPKCLLGATLWYEGRQIRVPLREEKTND